MRIHKLNLVEAFVAIDLEGAEASSGPVRCARKILQGGAKDLARSQTYTYATLGMRRGGASAGISADGDARDAAVAAFVAEARALVADGTYLPDEAGGISGEDLAPLHADDPRDSARFGLFAVQCEALGAAVAADRTIGGLDGRTVAIEAFHLGGNLLVDAVTERGGKVIAIASAKGSIRNDAGFPAGVLNESLASAGADVIADLGEADEPGALFDTGADVVFAGSKMGVIDHTVAARLTEAKAVVPWGRLPLTARALAVLRNAGVAAPADFVALAGSTLASWGDVNRTDAEVLAGVAEDIGDLSAEFAGHEDGPFLAACYAAESFLSTWQDDLPFGRPLAP